LLLFVVHKAAPSAVAWEGKPLIHSPFIASRHGSELLSGRPLGCLYGQQNRPSATLILVDSSRHRFSHQRDGRVFGKSSCDVEMGTIWECRGSTAIASIASFLRHSIATVYRFASLRRHAEATRAPTKTPITRPMTRARNKAPGRKNSRGAGGKTKLSTRMTRAAAASPTTMPTNAPTTAVQKRRHRLAPGRSSSLARSASLDPYLHRT